MYGDYLFGDHLFGVYFLRVTRFFAWSCMAVMQPEYKAPLETAGLLFMTTGGTILSSLASGYVLKRFDTGKVTFIRCIMTAGALLGFHFAPSLVWRLKGRYKSRSLYWK